MRLVLQAREQHLQVCALASVCLALAMLALSSTDEGLQYLLQAD